MAFNDEQDEGDSVTIYDIAREAGVTASTVSRVVNEKPGVKEETRRKVQELLKKYDYSPNIAARGLVKQSTKMVGILVEDIRVSHHIESAFVIEQELTRQGYCCIIMGAGTEGRQKLESIRRVEQRRVEGVVLIGSKFTSEVVREGIEKYLSKIPVVIVNGYMDLPNVSGVVIDEQKGVESCMELLYARGKRHIAFIVDQSSPSNLLKIEGYREKAESYGIDWGKLLYHTGESSAESGYEATRRLLTEHPETDGIVYSVDLIAAGGVRAAVDMGYEIPERLSLIGIDNSIYGEICNPRLSTLDNRMKDSSMLAAEMLRHGMEQEIFNQKHVLSTNILERETT